MLWYIMYLREKIYKTGPWKPYKTVILKLINYSCKQKPINDNHLGQVDKSQYLMKHPKKNTTMFSSEMKHVFHLKSNTCILMRRFID